MTDDVAAPGPDAPPLRSSRFGLRSAVPRTGLSVQSILLIMLLAVSLTSNVVVGIFGYVNARDSLQQAAFDKLVEVRNSRARELTALYDSVQSTMLVASRGKSVTEGSVEFNAAFDALADAPTDPAEDAAVTAYFSDDFGPALAKATGKTVDPTTFEPTGNAGRYLSATYTAPYASFEEAIANDDAGDGSSWSAVHATYHDYFRRMVEQQGYEDVLLINDRGDVVYSAYKGVDLGTNLRGGPYRYSELASAYDSAMASGIVDSVVMTDYEAYAPSLNRPAAWAVVPISVDGVTTGALAVELPIDRVGDVMTGASSWAESGLGTTGETYLVGSDFLMRSPSRVYVEHPKRYAAQAALAGATAEQLAAVKATGDTLMVQQVHTGAVTRALTGKAGTTITAGYLGGDTLVAYAPLNIHGLNWVVVAQMDTAEAFAPVADFTRNLVISSAVLALVVSVLSLLLAQILVRPLDRLRLAAQRIAAGEQGVQVDVGRSDELVSVGAAFNDMSRSLQVKAELLDKQKAENDRLVRSLMPDTMAKQYQSGVHTVASDHQEVSVLYADIVGFDDLSANRPSEESLELLNDLVNSFDEAAERHGVEHVRTTRQGYLASCGLAVPRVDNVRRIVEFALEAQQILDRFGSQHGATLALRAGIDTGTVTSGLVGTSHIVYDLWGDAVSLAFLIQRENPEPGIFVTQAVVDKLGHGVSYSEVGPVPTTGGTEMVWRVQTEVPDA